MQIPSCNNDADLIVLYDQRQVLCTKSSRRDARRHTCDGHRYLCAACAGFFGKHIISGHLMGRLAADREFILPQPLTWEAAREWS